MNIQIKPLTRELNEDYLDFFDHRAFTDDNPNGPCYCTCPTQDNETIRQMVAEFDDNGVEATLRKYAKAMLEAGQIHGYLAFDGALSIGWVNAADMDSYKCFVPDFAREAACGKTVSIVCFEIAPAYRGKGLALAFIERICADAKANGYAAVEGYAVIRESRDDYDFQGAAELYAKAGFTEAARQDGRIIMRKNLR